eukprot:333745_1
MAIELIDRIIKELNTAINKNKSNHQYTVQLLQKQHIQEAVELTVDAFCTRNEPVNLGAHIKADSFKHIVEYFVEQSVNKDCSTIAVEEKTGKIIGVVIGADMLDKPPESVIHIVLDSGKTHNANYPMVFDFFDDLDKHFVEQQKQKNQWEKGKMLHLYFAAVHKDYKRCGIVTKSIRNFVEIGRNHGFNCIISEATNTYAQDQHVKIGFKIVDEIYYEKWEYPKKSNQFPYASVVAQTGFDKACLMVYDL